MEKPRVAAQPLTRSRLRCVERAAWSASALPRVILQLEPQTAAQPLVVLLVLGLPAWHAT